MRTDRFSTIGRVLKTHGLHGGVLVAFATEAPLSVLVGMSVWLAPPPLYNRRTRIGAIEETAKGAVVFLEGVSDLSASSEIGRCSLLVETADLPPGFFDQEEPDNLCIGYAVSDKLWGSLGVITEFLETKANDVWVVEGVYGQVLLPIIDDVVLSVDDGSQTVEVHVLEGLIEGEPKCE